MSSGRRRARAGAASFVALPTLFLATSFPATLIACSEPASPEDASIAEDAPSAADTGAPVQDADVPDAPVGDPATLRGTIHRTAENLALEPPPDGRGDVYVMLFTSNPAVTDPPAMRVVAQSLPDVDLSTPDATIEYELTGIPPRGEPYYVVAFLDDDENANAADPRPTIGDGVTMVGGGVPTTTIDTPTVHTFDIDLNFTLFFTP
jgi:hypothetical protein